MQLSERDGASMTPIIWPTWKQAAQPVDVSHPSLHSAHYCPPALYFDLARRSRRDAPSAPTLGIAFVIGRDSILPQRAKPDYPPATCDLRPATLDLQLLPATTCTFLLRPPQPSPPPPASTLRGPGYREQPSAPRNYTAPSISTHPYHPQRFCIAASRLTDPCVTVQLPPSAHAFCHPAPCASTAHAHVRTPNIDVACTENLSLCAHRGWRYSSEGWQPSHPTPDPHGGALSRPVSPECPNHPPTYTPCSNLHLPRRRIFVLTSRFRAGATTIAGLNLLHARRRRCGETMRPSRRPAVSYRHRHLRRHQPQTEQRVAFPQLRLRIRRTGYQRPNTAPRHMRTASLPR